MADAQKQEPTVILCRAGNYMQASMIRQILEGEGVPCFTEGDNFNAIYGSMSTPFSAIKIHVRESDRLKAIEIVSDIIVQTKQKVRINTRPGEPKCPQCGYILYFARDQRCPECGRQFNLEEISMGQAELRDGVLQPRKD